MYRGDALSPVEGDALSEFISSFVEESKPTLFFPFTYFGLKQPYLYVPRGTLCSRNIQSKTIRKDKFLWIYDE